MVIWWYGMSCARPCSLLSGPAFLMPLYHALKILAPPKMWLKGRCFFINPHLSKWQTDHAPSICNKKQRSLLMQLAEQILYIHYLIHLQVMSYSSSYLTHFKKTLKCVHLDFCIADSSWNFWDLQSKRFPKMGQGSVPLNCSTKAKMIITTKPFHPTVLYNARVIQAWQWMTMVRILLDAASCGI